MPCNEMKVYVVSYGWDYEGEDEESVRVFADEAKAAAYRDAYKEARNRYNYALMLEREVE